MPYAKMRALRMMLTIYIMSVRLPSTFPVMMSDAMLHAGPTMSNTSAAPGESPLSMSATAMGMPLVAQRYIGMTNRMTASELIKVLS